MPEERLGRGAVPTLSLAQNTLLTRTEAVGRARLAAHGRGAPRWPTSLIARFNVKAGGPGAAAQSLSGGNLQKFIVGREIDAKPKVLIVAQPTWGVDVGAAAQIRAELLALRDAGCAVLVVSEELDELFEICDRLLVIAQRPPVARRSPTRDATVEQIGAVDDAACGTRRPQRRRPRMLRLEAAAAAVGGDVAGVAAARAGRPPW